MERTSEILRRNAAALPGGPLLLFNPPRDTLFRELAGRGPVRVFTQGVGDYEWLAASGAEARFGLLPWPHDEGNGDAETATVVLFLPREKDRLDFLLHAVATHLPPTGELWLTGENRAGIKSAGKRLEARFARVAKIDSARHCGLFRATRPQPGAAFRLETYRQQWALELPGGVPGGPLRIASLPGVFAHGRLDGGTALLLRYVAEHGRDRRIAGSVLDFGCGAGVIGLALLRANPELCLTLLDASAAALTSAAWSLEANGFPQYTVVPAGTQAGARHVAWYVAGQAAEAPQPPSGTRPTRIVAADGLPATGPAFDWIVSNPPFHRGVDRDFGIARRFFANAAARLAKNGTLLLVCNRHLPYEPWLGERFAAVESPLAEQGFKVLRATRPQR